MYSPARKITAATLAALLAGLACFEHALHDVSHAHQNEPTGDSCSHDHDGESPSSLAERLPAEHDADNCTVCRFLALPQLFEPPQAVVAAETLAPGPVSIAYSSSVSRPVTEVTIRGPPALQLERSC